jgi:hypothetical protein
VHNKTYAIGGMDGVGQMSTNGISSDK